MNIQIVGIPNSEQRYKTWGDYQIDESGNIKITVSNDLSELPTEDHLFLIGLHELIEVYLCKKRGITQKMVDDFDFSKSEYCEEYDIEPGDMKECPYGKEHRVAMIIEHLMAHELGLTGYGVIR